MSRLSPDTAIRVAAAEAQTLATFVEQVSTQLAAAAGHGLARDLRALAGSDLRSRFRVDVARPAALTDAHSAALADALGETTTTGLELPDRWTTAEGDRAVRAFTLDQPPLTPTGQLVPPYLVIALTADWQAASSVEELEELALHRSRVLLVALDPLPPAELRELARRLQRQAWLVDVRVPGAPESVGSRPWLEELASPEWEAGHATAQAFALTRACQQAVEAFDLLMRREGESLRVKKAMMEQRAQQVRGATAPVRAPELAREAEGLLKSEFTDFGRGITDRMAEWTAPQTGALGEELNREIAALLELHEQPMSNHVSLSVPPEFERRLLDLLHGRLLEHARRTMMSLVDLQELLRERIHERLRTAGVPPVPLSFGVPALGQFERFLRNRLLIEAPYRSEGTHGGMSDYFMAARKFAMPFTMVTGMLLSLVGAMSAFGSGNGAGMKQLKVGVVLLSLGAMVVGGVLVWRRAPVERAEKMARELEKARETLRRELRRMVADAEREWLRILAEHLRDQPAELRVALEAQLETHAQEQSKSGQEEHGRVERQKAGLANTERQLVEARSRREALGRSFDQLRDKLLQMFGEMQREASRRPSPPAPRGQAV